MRRNKNLEDLVEDDAIDKSLLLLYLQISTRSIENINDVIYAINILRSKKKRKLAYIYYIIDFFLF